MNTLNCGDSVKVEMAGTRPKKYLDQIYQIKELSASKQWAALQYIQGDRILGGGEMPVSMLKKV